MCYHKKELPYLIRPINVFISISFQSIFIDWQQWLKNMLKSELTELEMDMLLEDKILHEIIDEQYQW